MNIHDQIFTSTNQQGKLVALVKVKQPDNTCQSLAGRLRGFHQPLARQAFWSTPLFQLSMLTNFNIKHKHCKFQAFKAEKITRTLRFSPLPTQVLTVSWLWQVSSVVFIVGFYCSVFRSIVLKLGQESHQHCRFQTISWDTLDTFCVSLQ